LYHVLTNYIFRLLLHPLHLLQVEEDASSPPLALPMLAVTPAAVASRPASALVPSLLSNVTVAVASAAEPLTGTLLLPWAPRSKSLLKFGDFFMINYSEFI
jgi:hypothetical protein